MASVTEAPVVEAESLSDLPDTLYEVIDGQIVEKTMSAFETDSASILIEHLAHFLHGRGLGRVQSEMLFLIDQARNLKLRPDLAFVSAGRWPIRKRVPLTEAWDVIPDLAIEVISRSDGAGEMMGKTLEYQQAGVSVVWHVYPIQEVVLVFELPDVVRLLKRDDTLEGGTVLPGFKLPLATLFADDDEPAE